MSRPGDSVIVELIDSAGVTKPWRAFTTLATGLVVHESMGDPGWIVTHARSGLAVAAVDDPEQAQALAADLGAVCDWTRPGVDIVDDIEVAAARRAVIQRYEAWVHDSQGPMDRLVR